MDGDAATAEGLSRPEIHISERNHALAQALGINPIIHKDDFIYWFTYRSWLGDEERAVANYFELGKYSTDLIREVLAEIRRVKMITPGEWQPRTFLDFASGYGCTSRHLRTGLPEMEVATCDIHAAAVIFNSNVLGVPSHLSSPVPERLNLPKQDVIFALSFFSHMPNATYQRWLAALTRHLNPGGVLAFTANGYVTDTMGAVGSMKAGPNGFGFTPDSEQSDLDGEQYGLTLSYPKWVFYTLQQIPELRLARFQEAFWWARQDLYVCIRTEE